MILYTIGANLDHNTKNNHRSFANLNNMKHKYGAISDSLHIEDEPILYLHQFCFFVNANFRLYSHKNYKQSKIVFSHIHPEPLELHCFVVHNMRWFNKFFTAYKRTKLHNLKKFMEHQGLSDNSVLDISIKPIMSTPDTLVAHNHTLCDVIDIPLEKYSDLLKDSNAKLGVLW